MTRKTMSSLIEGDNEQMDPQHPRRDGPQRRRAFSASDKLAYLRAYEAACEQGDGGGYLRREGLYSSLISEWRKQRDAGVLAGKKPGEKVGKLSAEQAEIARLTRENAPGGISVSGSRTFRCRAKIRITISRRLQ
jgi:transposase-like protein